MWGIDSAQISVRKNNLVLKNRNFEWDSHEVGPSGYPEGSRGPPGELDESMACGVLILLRFHQEKRDEK